MRVLFCAAILVGLVGVLLVGPQPGSVISPQQCARLSGGGDYVDCAKEAVGPDHDCDECSIRTECTGTEEDEACKDYVGDDTPKCKTDEKTCSGTQKIYHEHGCTGTFDTGGDCTSMYTEASEDLDPLLDCTEKS
jgi:hypothetical protein